MKTSEAKIIIWLEETSRVPAYSAAKHIAARCKIDYAYTLHILEEMLAKGWVRKEDYGRNKYFFLAGRHRKKLFREAADLIGYER